MSEFGHGQQAHNLMSRMQFFANRTDRLGARLSPIANAAFMAKRYSGELSFEWRKTYDIEAPSLILREDFIRGHLVDRIPESAHLPILVEQGTICNIVSTFEYGRLGPQQRIAHPFGIYRETFDAPENIRQHISEGVFREMLHPTIIEAYERVGSSIGEPYISVHLRRGDLRDWLTKDENLFEAFHRYTPIDVVDEAMKGGRVVIFTDSPEALPSSYKSSLVENFVPKLNHLTKMQADLLDMLIMGGGERIFAAKSAFSSCSSVLGGRPVEHPLFLLGAGRFFDIMHQGTDPYYGRFTPEQVSASLDAAMHLLSRTQPYAKIADEVTAYFQMHFPEDYRAPLRHGHLMMYRGAYSTALSAFENAISLKPTPDAYSGMARALSSLKKIRQRDAIIQQAAASYPDDATIGELIRRWGLI